MELIHYWRALRDNWWRVMAGLIAGLVVAGIVTLLAPKTYTADTQLMFTVSNSSTVDELNSAASYVKDQMPTYQGLATAPIVLDPVIARAGLTDSAARLADRITVAQPTETALLQVSVEGASPEQAGQIASLIAQELSSRVAQLPVTDSTRKNAPRVTPLVVAPAAVRPQATSPNVAMNMGVGALVGLLIGAAWAVARESAAFGTGSRSSKGQEPDQEARRSSSAPTPHSLNS